MWLIGGSLRRPITVLIGVIAIMLLSVMSVMNMKKDIFPNLDIPCIYIIEGYGGMAPDQMEGFLTSVFEIYMLYVPGVEHVESKCIQNLSMTKLYFQPGTNMAEALSTTVGMVDRARSLMPEGTLMPFVLRFDAGSLPVGQLVLDSATKTIDELQDLAYVRVRSQLGSVPGASAPPPEGGNVRSIVIEVDTNKMRRYNLSGDDIVKALAQGNYVTPAGNVRTGNFMRMAPVNTDLPDIQELANFPVKLGPGPTVFIRDIAVVKDSSDILAGYALYNGKRTVYMPVLKRADASTLDVVAGVLKEKPHMESLLPSDVKLKYVFDQSKRVTDSIFDVVQEGVLGAILPGLMILLFLRDPRSTLIVVTTIPAAIMGALCALYATGQTINIQTLSGLALAIGILVDESTVNIENIHVHLSRGEPITRAVFNGSVETMVPRFLAMMSVLAVFVPSFFMSGITQHLFVPLSLAVGFAMMASFLLSSTLVPIMAVWLVRAQHGEAKEGPFAKVQRAHRRLIEMLMAARFIVIPTYLMVSIVLSIIFFSMIGREMFPSTETDEFRMRIRAPVGTRCEVLEQRFLETIEEIKKLAGPGNVVATLGYAGQQAPQFVISSVFLWTSGPHEGVLDVKLKEEADIDLPQFKEKLRARFAEVFPDTQYSFEPGDLVSQIINLGSTTPINVSFSGPDLGQSRMFAERVKAEMAKIPYLRDLQFGQPLDYPTVNIKLDRELAGQFGLTPADIGRSLLPATYSSRYVQLSFWFDRKSGVSYQIQMQIPQDQIASLEDVKKFPVMKHGDEQRPLLGDVAEVSYGITPGEYDRYNMMRMINLTANIQGKDLGSVGKLVERAVRRAGTPPRGVTVKVEGQVPILNDTFSHLFVGLALAVVVIFLMLSAYFQSPRLSLTVLSTSPAIICGVLFMLWITGTTLNVQSFMGAIMSIGVGVANAILLVAFAENNRLQGMSAEEAALHGAGERLRPILMTSIAMVSGMVPMAMALGGGQMSAPLGRAVIGGLTFSTLTALIILPVVFATIQNKASIQSPSLHPDDRGE